MNSLSQQISDLINPLPTLIDPEDDIYGETSAHKVLIDGNEVKDSEDIDVLSVLRRKKTQNLSEIDKRYLGKKVNRKQLQDSDCDESESDVDEDIASQRRQYSENMRASMASSEELDTECDTDSSNNSDTEDNGDKHQRIAKEVNTDLNEEHVNGFSRIDVNEEMSKGFALKNQFLIWDNLVECRIKFQKILIDVNKYPQFECLSLLKKSNVNQLNDSLKESSKVVKMLLNLLIDIDLSLDSQNDLLSTQRHSVSENEKLRSGDKNQLTDHSLSVETKSKRRLSDSEYSDLLSKRHCNLSAVRDQIIDKWYEKTRFTSSGFRHKSSTGMESMEQSSTQQINRILSDMERLVRRTQTKRSLYNIIGKTDINSTSMDTNQSNEEQSVKCDDNDIDPEIFDDNDFYHQLLRELIDSKTGSDSCDPIVLSQKWIEIQKLRKKLKRKVDTKASKGRQMRYDVHSKLVNFMAPVDNSTYTESSKDQLFNSLFR